MREKRAHAVNTTEIGIADIRSPGQQRLSLALKRRQNGLGMPSRTSTSGETLCFSVHSGARLRGGMACARRRRKDVTNLISLELVVHE